MELPKCPPQPIKRPYLLVIHIPYFIDSHARVWLDRLWHRDFVRHLAYLHHVEVAAEMYPLPKEPQGHGLDLVAVDIPPDVTLNFVPLRPNASRSIRISLRNAVTLWKAVGRNEIVHSHIIGYPSSWIANWSALLRRKQLMLMIEGAPWRQADAGNPGWRARLRVRTLDAIGRWFVNHASISFFTQPSYRDEFLTRAGRPGFITPASWIDETDVLDRAAAATAWGDKLGPGSRARLLFAGRLVPEKGVNILLDALAILRRRDLAIDIDMIGEGHLRPTCVAAAAAGGQPRLRVLDPVAYGAAFFALLNRYHAVIIPSLSDEQPRIVFDAYARALPVIAADTDGLRPNVFPGQTGWLVAAGDAARLADAIAQATASLERLESLGLSALEYARAVTHRQMHDERWRRLADHLERVNSAGNAPRGIKAAKSSSRALR